MYLLSIDLYELGQFLRILLWIALPMVIIVLLVTTYLHYRKKKRSEQDNEDYAPGGPVEISLENTGNAYRGLLWMKDKYEQYVDQTDNKIERLKAELARAEQKYLGLLGERGDQKTVLLPAPSGTIISSKKTSTPGSLPAIVSSDSTPEEPAFSEAGLLAETSGSSDTFGFSEIIIPAGSEASIPVEATLESTPPQNLAIPESSPEEIALRDLVAEKDKQIELLHTELDQRIKNYHELDYQHSEDKARAEELAGQYQQTQQVLETRQQKVNELNQLLETRQGKVDELNQLLETQQLKFDELNQRLGHEMSKVGDLTGKLENNMKLLFHIHQELDKSLHVQQPDNTIPARDELPSYEEATPDPLLSLTENTKIVGWIESEESEIKMS